MSNFLNKQYNYNLPNIKTINEHYHSKFLVNVFVLVTCIKVLLIPTYHSTDFEVHRNWLAITYSLPIREWYTSEKSQWTLDYPPLFAWFEYGLSKIANLVDSEIVNIDNFNYDSFAAKLFQRFSVIFSDLMLVYGMEEVGQTFCESNQQFLTLYVLCLSNIGLLVIDHIHFQYNGFLLGMLLLSLGKVAKVSSEKQLLQGALWFAILLNFKHLYLYVAPAYGVWLLRNYCLKENRYFYRFMKLALIVIFVFSLSFGPFINQIPQVLLRLFPFKRGLVHAYWAANAWALYTGADKLLCVIWRKVGWLNNIKIAGMTGGLVKEDIFIVLPTPNPIVTFLVTFSLMIPAIWILFFNKKNVNKSKKFIKCVILCGLTSFIFGWHVHEKAILTAIIPLCILAATDVNDAKTFILLSSAGHTALFPLLYPSEYMPLKIILWSTYLLLAIAMFKKQFHCITLHYYEWFYIILLPIVTIYETVLHKIIFIDRLPFLPLALTSMYCSLGIIYCYITYYYRYINEDKLFHESICKSKR